MRFGTERLDAQKVRTLPVAQQDLVGRRIGDEGAGGGLANVLFPNHGNTCCRSCLDDRTEIFVG